MNKKKGRRGQRLLTALLCLALCAADIMPVSMTAWASEQMPQNIVADDNVSGSADEGNNAAQDQNDADEGKGDLGDSEDSADNEDSNDFGNQADLDDEESSEDRGTSEDTEDSDDEETDGDLEDDDSDLEDSEDDSEEEGETEDAEEDTEYPENAEKTEADVNGVVNQTAGLEDTFADDDIANGVSNKIAWRIDKDGKLTVEGTGNFRRIYIGENFYGNPPWYEYVDSIYSAEINVSGMTDASYMFYECSNMVKVDLSGFDVSNKPLMEDFFTECNSLSEIRTPKNVQSYIRLPKTDISDVWYQYDETRIKTVVSVPRDNESTHLIKNAIPDIDVPYIEAVKTKVEYINDEIIDTDDITIIYHDADGSITKYEEDYTTDAEKVDMSEPGTKVLTVTYTNPSASEELEAEIELTIKMHARISAYKTKTEYRINEILNTDDITILYYDDMNRVDVFYDGYTTNANEIDMSIPGKKTLTVTYKDPSTGEQMTAEIELTVLNVFLDDIAGGLSNDITWRIDKDGKLIVEGTGDYVRSSSNLPPWLDERSEIVSAEINVKGMTNASSLFSGCPNLADLDLSNFDTSSVTNMQEMFIGCQSITSLSLNGLNTENVTNMESMFKNCEHLTSLDLGELNTAQVTNMYGMFNNCQRLTNLNISNFDTGNVQDMSWMFNDCKELTSLDVSSFDTGNVTLMIGMFYNCSKLTSLDVSRFDTGNVTNFAKMFYNCRNLTALDVSGFITDKAIGMTDMFYLCRSLTDLDVSRFDTANVKFMSSMFGWCAGLESLDVSNFNTSNVEEMREMFYYCSSLKNVDVSHFDTSQVLSMSAMFSCCNSLTSVDVSHFDTSNVRVMSDMFYACSGLKSVDVSHFDTGNVTNMSRMFYDCSNLKSVDVSHFDTRNVKDMSGMFWICRGMTSLDVSSFDTGNVTNMKNMFSCCNSLESLDISNFDTGNVTDMQYMFWECNSLESLNLSNFDAGKVVAINGMLDYCSALSTIYTPYNLTQSVVLPAETSSDIWYKFDGTAITELPQDLSYSIVIYKNNTPEVTVGITASKTKTAYICGETVNINDITVTYFNSKGEIRKLTEGFTTNVDSIDMSVPGIKELIITYVDPETKTTENPEGTALTTTLELTVTFGLTKENVTITLYDEDLQLYYNGFPQNPEPIVTVRIGGADKTLVLKEDYTVSYANNINAGEKAVLIITGSGDYSGTVESNFTIASAALVITACDLNLAIGDPLPEGKDYLYQTTGLVTGDVLLKEPSFTCDITDTTELGTYPIIPNGADAGTNYEITYRNGTLTVAEERVIYKVSFNMMGHGTNIAPITGIKAGSLITEPTAPEAEGYVFTGWYKDTTFAAKQKWNFGTDTVQADTTLHACWIEKAAEDGSGLQLSIQDIQDQYFTGSAIKPTVYVYTADGRTLLKSGKDYTVKYADNTNVGEARVTITGKGNYKETVDKSFTILPADISADDGNVAAGFTLKYTEQLVVNKSKVQKPFTSLKYKKAMKAGADYEVKLTALTAYDADEVAVPEGSVVSASNGTTLPTIPKGCHGTFRMTVTGKGNYTGSFAKTIIVAGKNQLMKNAAVSIGKKQKSLVYDGKTAVILTPGWYDKDKKKYYKVNENGIISDTPETDAKSIFTVKAGNEYLKSGLDYTVSYTNNKAVGTATMTITGNPEKGYYGSKSVTFKLTGKNFSANAINVGGYVASMPYTGRAITQNKVILTPKPTADDAEPQILLYGIHYTISYKNNIKKGTATMTFTAKPESGYTGSFKKTFKITAQSIAATDIIKVGAAQSEGHEQDSIVGLSNTEGNITGYRLNGDIAYVKGGVKPSDRIVLTNSENITLKEGTDYTVKYKNNAAITTPDMEDSKKPYMTVTGKGNYAGTLTVYFDITQAELTEGQITVTPMILNTKNNYEYKPSVKVTDSVSGKVLSAGENKDYTITYENNGQENVRKYVSGDESAAQPMVVVKVPSSGTGSYKLAEGVSEIKVPLPIYQTKLTSSNLYVIVSEDPAQITYTGDTGTDERIRPVTPDVTVYYGEAAAVKAAKQNKVTDETELTKQDGAYKLIKLKEVSAVSDGQTDTASSGTGDYTVSYGANVTAGKNKGTVTITGTGVYGGSVTVKFEILKRSVYVAP